MDCFGVLPALTGGGGGGGAFCGVVCGELTGGVVFVEVGVVGVAFGEVVSVGEPVGPSVVVSTVEEEFCVVWSVLG